MGVLYSLTTTQANAGVWLHKQQCIKDRRRFIRMSMVCKKKKRLERGVFIDGLAEAVSIRAAATMRLNCGKVLAMQIRWRGTWGWSLGLVRN
jgi:hypothetical protein